MGVGTLEALRRRRRAARSAGSGHEGGVRSAYASGHIRTAADASIREARAAAVRRRRRDAERWSTGSDTHRGAVGARERSACAATRRAFIQRFWGSLPRHRGGGCGHGENRDRRSATAWVTCRRHLIASRRRGERPRCRLTCGIDDLGVVHQPGHGKSSPGVRNRPCETKLAVVKTETGSGGPSLEACQNTRREKCVTPRTSKTHEPPSAQGNQERTNSRAHDW